MEGGFESDVSVSPRSPKQEPGQEDEDRYEDSLDLDTSESHSKVWLVRMPRYLMDVLNDEKRTLSGREIGKVRIRQQQQAVGKVRLVLNDFKTFQDIPQSYNLSVTQPQVNSSFVFREQDLPKRTRSQQDTQRPQSHFDKYTPQVKQAPKRTALVGQVAHECNLVPDFNDPSYSHVLAKRRQMELPNAESQATLLDGTAGVGGVKYGATLRAQKASWLRPQQQRKAIQRNPEGKATRIPRNELLDMLFRLFEQSEYWSLKSLRERTRQPEVYLRDVLEAIAVLHKRGPQASKYGLRDEFKQLQTSGASVASMVQQAPPGTGNSDEELEDVDVDEDMEDVPVS